MTFKKIAPIALVAVAAYLVWRNWDTISAKFRK